MTCSNCERDIPVDAVFCPYCGYKQIVHANDHAFVVETLDENLEKTDDFENSELTNNQSELACNQPNFTRHKEKKKGFKWFHFIIYFQIWMYMLASIVNGFNFTIGPRYGDWTTTETIYSAYPELKSIDITFGVVMFVLVVFAFITRQHLVRFKSTGPKYYLVICLSYAILNIIYAFMASFVSGIEVRSILTSNEIIEIVVSIIFTAINLVYFRKRKNFFIS